MPKQPQHLGEGSMTSNSGRTERIPRGIYISHLTSDGNISRSRSVSHWNGHVPLHTGSLTNTVFNPESLKFVRLTQLFLLNQMPTRDVPFLAFRGPYGRVTHSAYLAYLNYATTPTTPTTPN